MKHINVHMLAALDACPYQISRFGEVFGEGDVALTEANVVKAIDANIEVSWLAQFLDETAWEDTARVEYQKASDLAWAECHKVRGQAWAKYYKKAGAEGGHALALAECEKACDLAWSEFYKMFGLRIIRSL